MNRTDFVYSVSRIRAIETKLLDKLKIERMKDASSLNEVLRILEESDYADMAGNIKRTRDYEKLLSEELIKLYKLMYEITPDKRIIDLFSLKYDYHNVKVCLKEKYSGGNFENMLIKSGTISLTILSDSIRKNDFRNIDPLLKEAAGYAEHCFQENKDSQMIDLILDKYQYKDMLIRAEELNNIFLINFVKINIDLLNIKTFLRVKRQGKGTEFLSTVILGGGKIDKNIYLNSLNNSADNLISKLHYTDYYKIIKYGLGSDGKNENIAVFEKLSDNFLMNIMKDTRLMSFGPEQLAAYIYAKEAEIKLLRIMIVGKMNNIPPEIIGERLRDCYV